MRAIGFADLQKWMPRSDLLTVDLPSFGKWMLTLAISIFIVGAASTGTLNLVSSYAVRPPAQSVPAPSPAELRSMEPVQLISPAAAKEADPVPAATPPSAASSPPSADPAVATETIPAAEVLPAKPRMMATLSLAVRSRPQKESAQVGALQQGEIVEIGGAQHGWYLVTAGNGASGWSWGRYLEPVDPQVAADSPFWAAQGQNVAFAQ